MGLCLSQCFNDDMDILKIKIQKTTAINNVLTPELNKEATKDNNHVSCNLNEAGVGQLQEGNQ